MAITTQDIQNYLAANPGMSDAQIAAAMDQYGVTAAQMSAATGVPLADVSSRYTAATISPQRSSTSVLPSFDPTRADSYEVTYGGELNQPIYYTTNSSIGNDNVTIQYDPQGNVVSAYGSPFSQDGKQYVRDYDAQGNVVNVREYSKPSWWSDIGQPALFLGSTALGANLLGPLLSGAGAGATGASAADIAAMADVGMGTNTTLQGLLGDASFIAADASQLAAQTGNNVAAIQQNLIAAGVDPIVAATAADAAALGLTPDLIASQIASAGQAGAGSLFTGGTAADLALGGISTAVGAPPGSVLPGTPASPPTGGGTGGGGTGAGSGGGGGTGGLPGGLTNVVSGLLSNPNNLAGLLALLAGSQLPGGGSGVGSIPTQGLPTNSPEYFNQVQGFLNQYLPGQLPTQGQYLSSWYNNTPGSYMPGGGGMMNPPAPAPAQGDGKGKGRDNRPIRDTGPRRPVPAPLPPVSLEDIRGYLGSRPGMTDQEIAAAMQQYGVSPQQMAEATGIPYSEVLQRYLDAKQANLTNSILSSMQAK